MHGKDVSIVQHRLAGEGEGKFGNYHPGKVDGEYGEHTAGAARRAKYWLGYKGSEIDHTYGMILDAYITKRKPLSSAMKVRRAYRIKHAGDKPFREEVLSKALTQLGETEHPPDSNISKFSTWYGMIGPWCAMFVSWCQAKLGGTFHYSYCPYILRDARAGKNGLAVVSASHVKPGHGVLYDWDNNGVPDHVGFFHSGNPQGQFTAVEGNTAVGNNSNGGIVMKRTDRVASEVVCFFQYEKTTKAAR